MTEIDEIWESIRSPLKKRTGRPRKLAIVRVRPCLGRAPCFEAILAMDDTSSPLHYTAEDHRLRTVEQLSVHARLSCAFIRLCIEAGCPVYNKRLSHAILLNWLTIHHGAVRAMAGLRPLAPIDGVPPKVQRELRLANTMLTLLDFAESRCSNQSEKAHLRRMHSLVERGN
jgi:hypothetical protein